MKADKIVLMALAFASLLSCARDFRETEDVFSVNTLELVVPADAAEGRNMVKDTLFVTSNVSWTTELGENVDWVSMGVAGHENISRISEISSIPFEFLDNDSDYSRSVKVHISSSNGQRDVIIRQQPIKRRLVLTSGGEGFDNLNADGDTCRFTVNSNIAWKVYVSNSSTVEVELSTSEGAYSGEVEAVVKPNTDMYAAKTGKIVFSAEGCESIEVALKQNHFVPYFELPEGDSFEAPGGVDDFRIPINTNTQWRMEILSAQGYPDGSVKAPKGSAVNKTAKIIFPSCRTFGKDGRIDVQFVAEGIKEPVKASVTQKALLRMAFGLVDYHMYSSDKSLNMSEETWPFTTPSYSEVPAVQSAAVFPGVETDFTLKTGENVKMFSTLGFWKDDFSGLMCGGAAGDYIVLPSEEGYRLTKVEYCFRGQTPIEARLVDMAGTDVPGTAFKTGGRGSVSTVNLPATTKPGERFKIVLDSAFNFQIGEIVLYYE